MNRKTIYSLILCLLLISVGLYANGQQESQLADSEDQNKITVLVEGFTQGSGLIDESIAGFETQLKNAETPIDKVEYQFRINYWGAVRDQLNAKGIILEGIDWGWAEALAQKEVNSLLAGSGPDVFVGETHMPGFAAKGYLTPFPADVKARIKEAAMPGAYLPMTIDDEIYGIATFPGVSVLLWNKELVAKAGLDPDKAPANWAELLANAEKITKQGNGETFGGGCYAGPHFGGSLRYGAWLLENGGGFIDKDYKPAFNTAANIETVEFLRELNKNLPTGLAGDPNEGAFWDSFNQGKIAYVIDGPWRQSQAESNGIEVGYSLIPLPTGSEQQAAITIGAAFYGVPTYSKNKEAAFDYIEALISPEVQEAIRVENYRPVVRKSYKEDSAYMNSYMGTFFKSFEGNVQGLPTFAGEQNARIWEILHNAVTEAVVTDGDVASILTGAQNTAIKLVD